MSAANPQPQAEERESELWSLAISEQTNKIAAVTTATQEQETTAEVDKKEHEADEEGQDPQPAQKLDGEASMMAALKELAIVDAMVEDMFQRKLEGYYNQLTTEILPLHIWRTLDQSEREIRLVSVLPADDEREPVECRLVTVSLDCLPRYEAISYAWQALGDTKFILLNKVPWKVSTNLLEALKVFRKLENQTLLWIDSLAINQTSIEEKNYQIPLMREIYSSANATRIWLGSLTAESMLSMQALQLLPHTGKEFADNMTNGSESLKKLVMCLAELFERTWWQRLWTLQEYILSARVELYCGEQKISRTELEAGIAELVSQVEKMRASNGKSYTSEDLNDGMSLGFLMQRVIPQSQNLQAMAELHAGVKSGSVSNFTMLLSRARSQAVTNDRDRIYGLLGMAPESLDVPVDYKLTVEEVYTQAAFAIIRAQGSLALLVEASSTPKRNSDESEEEAADSAASQSMPSWVPDWRTPFCPAPLAQQRLNEMLCDNGCCSGDHGELSLSLVDGCKLLTCGQIIDKIVKVSPNTTSTNDGARLERLSKTLSVEKWNQRLFFMPDHHAVRLPKEGEPEVTIGSDIGPPKPTFANLGLSAKPTKQELYEVMKAMMEDMDEHNSWSGMMLGTDFPILQQSLDRRDGKEPIIGIGEKFPRKAEMMEGARWRAFRTDTVLYGIANERIQEGDVLAVLAGGTSLYVLRPVSAQHVDGKEVDAYRFVSTCASPAALESALVGYEYVSERIDTLKTKCQPWYSDGEESFGELLLI